MHLCVDLCQMRHRGQIRFIRGPSETSVQDFMAVPTRRPRRGKHKTATTTMKHRNVVSLAEKTSGPGFSLENRVCESGGDHLPACIHVDSRSDPKGCRHNPTGFPQRTNEQTNEQTNKRTNKQDNEQQTLLTRELVYHSRSRGDQEETRGTDSRGGRKKDSKRRRRLLLR